MFTIFQYMICCYSTIIKAFEQAQKEVFQYIPYYYSTFPVENPLINLLEFQYISCCYSTNTILFNFIKSRPFQYILCYYSTFQAEQLATIFQYVLCYYSTFDSCPFFIFFRKPIFIGIILNCICDHKYNSIFSKIIKKLFYSLF